MSTADQIDLINTVTLVLDITLILAIAVRQGARFILFWGKSPPVLLVRDFIFFWVLVILLAVPLIFGAATDIHIGDSLVWVSVRAILGLIALVMWFYYEYFVIGRGSRE